jgi:hypothetical protein
LSFSDNNGRVDVLFCFDCDILLVFQNDRACGGANFDPAHNFLVAEIKRLFPEDGEIQGLSLKSN